MTAEKLESPLDPLLAALANFHSSADLSRQTEARPKQIEINAKDKLPDDTKGKKKSIKLA